MDSDKFESQDFYELMQAYRHAPRAKPMAVVVAFEAVKEFARRAAPLPPAPTAAPWQPMAERISRAILAAECPSTVAFDRESYEAGFRSGLHVAAREALIAAAPSGEPATAWLPIASAPKRDLVQVLVTWPGALGCAVGAWSQALGLWTHGGALEFQPTHYQPCPEPLPEPPTPQPMSGEPCPECFNVGEHKLQCSRSPYQQMRVGLTRPMSGEA